MAPADSSDNAPKRQKTEDTRLTHPYGVQPLGHYFADQDRGIVECRTPGLGRLACVDDLYLLSLLNCLSAKDLDTLGQCSRACYIFSRHDELWRVLTLEEFQGDFCVRPTWRDSYIASKTKRTDVPLARPLSFPGFYSDLLFQSFYCAKVPVAEKWVRKDNMDRINADDFTVEQFRKEYEIPNRPVLIQNCVSKWPAAQKWTDEYLATASRGKTYSAGGYQMSMEKYLEYSRTLKDDQPLFIFDRYFASKAPQLGEDYSVPSYFQEDLFHLLGDSRPFFRWLIIGPERSGSTFHIDPNSTNAWNAVLRGKKKWIMFPPEIIPPGVHPNEDLSDVSTPVSLMEWFVTFYRQAEKLPKDKQPIECVCGEGEMVFVPHNWWHLVLNLEESVAITQNYVSSANLKSVVRFLRDKPDQVSGFDHLEQRKELPTSFEAALQDRLPEAYDRVCRELSEEEESRKSKWEKLVAEPQSASFSFGFQL